MFLRNNPGSSAKLPILCYVTDRHALPSSADSDPVTALVRNIAQLAAAGIDWIQIREKDLSAKALASLTREALLVAANFSARIILNDRLDVAIAERTHGVHLGEASLPSSEAKRVIQSAQSREAFPQDFLLGASCHSLDSAKAASSAGADYLIFGPVFQTPSKSQYGEPQGLARLAEVCRSVSIPVLAIGGITLGNARHCLRAGASGLAAIRLFQDSPDPALVLTALRKT